MIQYIYNITPTSNSANAAMWQDYISNLILIIIIYSNYRRQHDTFIQCYIECTHMPTITLLLIAGVTGIY